jgi:hypothetical protein
MLDTVNLYLDSKGIVARIATKHDVEILRVLMNSGKFRRRYDPLKWEPTEITIRNRHV